MTAKRWSCDGHVTCILRRLYLRPTAHLDSLIAGDVANQMVKEGKIHKDLLNLDAMEIAHEMTRKVCVVCVYVWCVCVCVVCLVCVCGVCTSSTVFLSSRCSLLPQQSEVYQGIDPAEFVNYLYKLEDSIGIEQIEKFQQVRYFHIWVYIHCIALSQGSGTYIVTLVVNQLFNHRVSCSSCGQCLRVTVTPL